MVRRRAILGLTILGAVALLGQPSAAFAKDDNEAIASILLDKYVAAVNAHDTSTFPELFTDDYIQHSGRSPSGLAAQIENFRRIMATMPDVRMRVEDRIIAGDRVVARTTYSATHTQPIRGVAPTGKPFSFRTIDIWRVANGKFAEHWDLTDAGEVIRQLGGQ